MVKKKTKKLIKNIMFWLGALIVIATHVAIIAIGLPQDMLGGHAFINLIAATLIIGQRFIK